MVNFSEIILTAAVILAVWYGFRWYNRAQARPRLRDRPPAAGRVEDLVACTICGDYAPAGTAACKRADCPRR